MKTEKTQKFYIPSDVQKSIGEAFGKAFGKAFGEVMKMPIVDSSFLMMIQLAMEQENERARETFKREAALIKRRNEIIETLQEILGTKNFIKEEKEAQPNDQ